MLQTELTNMRTRIKAMQETIDVLITKNTQLLAEKATGAWLNTDAGIESNMTDVIQGYLKEIEELRAKLLESEHMCGQLRKNSSAIKTHHTSFPSDEYSSKELIVKAKQELENEKQTLQRLISVKSQETESEPSVSDGIFFFFNLQKKTCYYCFLTYLLFIQIVKTTHLMMKTREQV